jgi:hypothetical protein
MKILAYILIALGLAVSSLGETAQATTPTAPANISQPVQLSPQKGSQYLAYYTRCYWYYGRRVCRVYGRPYYHRGYYYRHNYYRRHYYYHNNYYRYNHRYYYR